MPIAVDMNGGRGTPTRPGLGAGGGPGATVNGTAPASPASPRMTKAAFFRARSPPIQPIGGMALNRRDDDLSSGFDALQARIDPFNGRYTPDSSSESGHGNGVNGGGYSQQQGYTSSRPPTSSDTRSTDQHSAAAPSRNGPGGLVKYRMDMGHSSPTSPASLNGVMANLSVENGTSSGGYAGGVSSSGGHGVVNGSALGQLNGGMMRSRNNGRNGSLSATSVSASGHVLSDDDDYGDGIERGGSTSVSGSTDIAGGSEEMMMTLLAGQAAVDCENLPIGIWEEVDSWKKASPAHRNERLMRKVGEMNADRCRRNYRSSPTASTRWWQDIRGRSRS